MKQAGAVGFLPRRQSGDLVAGFQGIDPGSNQRVRVFAEAPIEARVMACLMGADDDGGMLSQVRKAGRNAKREGPIA